ncbi:hypothetical protein HK100_005614 [Physocladia obscura]|uniref:FAD-binding domain-containing protein n=1 Tax=Physocladia obscura TaxID=109957 RepID=A0AAD5STJ2_9FUNG|nr:hypothetical protein HK100_005614 [Physocladia obscura]
MVQTTVLVVGAGMAGCLAAIAIKKRGFSVKIYDMYDPGAIADPQVLGGVSGGLMGVYSNGLRALDRLDLLDAVVEASAEANAAMPFYLMDGSDQIIKDDISPVEGVLDQRFLLRQKLHAILGLACGKAGVQILARKKFVSLTQTEEGVWAKFADGDTVFADLLVGADGIHSAVRRCVFGESAKHPTFWGIGYMGIYKLDKEVPHEEVPLRINSHSRSLYTDPLRAISIATVNNEKDKVGTWIINDMDKSKISEDENWRPYSDLPKESKRLAIIVEEWGAPKALVSCVRNAERITPVSLYDLPDLPSLHSGRVLLVGDAGHGTIPTMGQGVNMAMEDAGVLFDLLTVYPDFGKDYATVFKLFDKIRVPRVHHIAAESRAIAKRLNASTPLRAKFIRIVMRIVFAIKNQRKSVDKIVAYDYRSDVIKTVDSQFAAAST